MTRNMLVRIAVGATLAGASFTSFALTPNQVPENNRVYIGGATATNDVLRDVFLSSTVGLCQAGTIDVYEGTNQRAVLCTARAGLGAQYAQIQGQPIGYIKESNGGSGNGTQPVANQTSLVFMNLGNTATGGGCTTTQTNVSVGAGLHNVTLRTGCNATFSRAPGAGIADVEARLLNASPAEQALLNASGLTDVVFGVPVSTPFYRALQQAQGLATNDDCANAPTLTRNQVAAMYSGFIGVASQLVSANAGDEGVPLPEEQIYVCRRGDTSGTQAGTEAHFLRQRCEEGVATFVTPDEADLCLTNGCTWPGGTGNTPNFTDDIVYAGSGSGQVRSCLDFHGDNNHFAIGVLSTESNPFSGSGLSFRWVRVDGALSTLEQTANGNWSFFTSNVLNRRNPNVLTNQQNQIVNYFVNNVGNPTFIAGLNSPFKNNICLNGGATAAGDGGVLAVAGTPFPAGIEAPYTSAEMASAPINAATKQPIGAINNCQPPMDFATTPAGGQFRNNVPEF
jgi:hypothetical protein